jgi:mannose-6-phosphate isomerase-like protein (cupin superfamily)
LLGLTKNGSKRHETKVFDSRQGFCDIPAFSLVGRWDRGGQNLKFLSLILMVAFPAMAQERTVDPTWLHRYVPQVAEAANKMGSPTCHYQPIFGEGDHEANVIQSVARFAKVTIDPNGNCQIVEYDREEELYFILQGSAVLQYGSEKRPMQTSDFTYLAPGTKHSLANTAQGRLQVLVMGFKIPAATSIGKAALQPKIVNLDAVKEETVSGHPTSVLYKLLAGPRTGQRDAIDDAYVITSFFLMDFAPGGTNFPHHHETAEEIYLVLDGEGLMVAGSGSDGVEGRFPAQAGDAYYFRPNCTVGFYNQNKPGAKAHILAVRSKVPLPRDAD